MTEESKKTNYRRASRTLLYLGIALVLILGFQFATQKMAHQAQKHQEKEALATKSTEDKDSAKIEIMEEAITLASENIKKGGGPFGSIIIKDGKVIARAGNTVTSGLDPTAHAEISATRQACKTLNSFDLNGCEIYSSCEPCPMCLSAIYLARISKLYFSASRFDAADAGFDDSFLYEEIAVPIEKRKIPVQELIAQKGKSPFVQWKKTEKKIAD
ncbi:MAG: nucleoside deaminase [Bacteroidales bacterium]